MAKQNCDRDFVTKESVFTHLMASEVHYMWQKREQGEFKGVDGIPIRWISIRHPQNERCVVIVNGRNESFWKYQELCYELSRKGYDVYAYDHRGQGASGRLTNDSELGHVICFNDYVSDLHSFITNVVGKQTYRQRFLLAHSMGGAVATLYLEHYQTHFNAVVLNAPMFGINLPVPLKLVASSIAKIIERYQTQPSYVFGHKPYHEAPFEENDQCQSQIRYIWAKHLYQLHPELRVGGPSARWVWQALAAAKSCIRDVEHIHTPVLLLQAGDDTVVDNASHHLFYSKCPECKMKVIPHARHELLMEKDCLRNQALEDTLDFFETYS